MGLKDVADLQHQGSCVLSYGASSMTRHGCSAVYFCISSGHNVVERENILYDVVWVR
jgi:hypothetical protein